MGGIIVSNKVYIFNAMRPGFASAVFSSFDLAQAWIQKNYVCGILTEYPLDQSCYDWARQYGHFKDKSPIDRAPIFIANFVSAYQKTWHFEHGELLQRMDA